MKIAVKILLIQLCLVFGIHGYSQISFSKKVYDFGVLENWNPNPAEFDFTNSGKSAFMIIMAQKSSEIRVVFPRTEIQPNEKGKIQVYYEPYNTGVFYEKILLYTSQSNSPTELIIKGKIKY